ncbi:MAG: cyclic nucleotide-binding domain-containing protein [Frankiaceae bacterium]|nr:cyclic nucleotide-binding domain-containing protein [Frankiaceae bacterium]
MKVTGSATSISWIPSEAVTGPTKATFGLGISHYDSPPPDVITDLEGLCAADGFRFANRLTVTAEFDGDRLVSHDVEGGIVMGATTVNVAKLGATFEAVSLPDLRAPVEKGPGWVRVTQTCGGRTALPLPRPVRHPPFVKLQAPIVWTTIALTLHSDGRTEVALPSASRFPRHWVYDTDGKLVLKTALAEYHEWMAHSFGKRTPWGNDDSQVVTTAAETALERDLSTRIMRADATHDVHKLDAGTVLAKQGDPGDELYLLLDGVLSVDVDGESVAELGPGAVVGERAVLEGGRRTSTLTASTRAKVAAVAAADIDLDRLRELAEGHNRESADS